MPPFQIIPAWRVARLRAALRDLQRRGADPGDDGADLVHRAARRRFDLGRAAATVPPSAPVRTTRKGRSFPLAKQVAIWRAILALRPPDWQPGDPAAFGSLRRAREMAAAACDAAGLAAPRYGTIRVLWHRGVPSDAVRAILAAEEAEAGDS